MGSFISRPHVWCTKTSAVRWLYLICCAGWEADRDDSWNERKRKEGRFLYWEISLLFSTKLFFACFAFFFLLQISNKLPKSMCLSLSLSLLGTRSKAALEFDIGIELSTSNSSYNLNLACCSSDWFWFTFDKVSWVRDPYFMSPPLLAWLYQKQDSLGWSPKR